ncbi:MAG: DUF3791 domain-containing protein [Dysgonamonadaceae bacterium]|jgi:hypothetical protein|nr:DUF3791 domain-containing protein [Dysgonamonadaceae bacterium]
MQQTRDENLMLVSAVEQYACIYKMPTAAAFGLFDKYGINKLIRRHYNALHTQSLDENFYFADDILKRKMNEQ